jgi:hypothetical protein
MSDRRLKVYCEALEGISLQAVREAYAIVRDSDEFKRLPPPGQFRALAVRAEAAAPSTQTSSEDLEGGRATLEEIDEIFAQFKAAHPPVQSSPPQ